MKCIKTTDAVGHVLCHDITRIVKDVVKDPGGPERPGLPKRPYHCPGGRACPAERGQGACLHLGKR